MTTSAAQYRALVVDDEPLIRQALIRALRSENFVCEPAANGREALEWISEFRYDLVVTDVRMPEHNGHALAVDLLALPHRPVIVVLTGVLEPRIANDLRVRGVDDVLFKPVDFHYLASHARSLVEARKTETQKPDLNCAEVRHIDDGARAADPARPLNETPSRNAAEAGPRVPHAEMLIRTSVASGSEATQRDEPRRNQQMQSGQLVDTSGVPQDIAMTTTDLPQRVVRPQPVTNARFDRSAVNPLPPGDDAQRTVARQIVVLKDQLRTPPESYDGFAIASGNNFNIPVLTDAVLRNPSLIHDVLRMTNAVLYGASQALRNTQGSAVGPQVPAKHLPVMQQPSTNQAAAQHPLTPVIIFALGIGLGWLLAWLGPAVWLR